nr:hypothetical protein [Tanacetum cinerariifolium]
SGGNRFEVVVSFAKHECKKNVLVFIRWDNLQGNAEVLGTKKACQGIKTAQERLNVEDTSSKAMVAIDGAGFDWSYMADDEVPTNMARMDFSDSEVSDSHEDESEEMVLKSDNVQHKPEQANQPKKMVQKHVLKNVEKGTVLTKFRIVPISIVRQSSSRAAAPVSAARPINTNASKPLVNVEKPRENALQNSYSLSRRPFCQQTALKNKILNNKVDTAKVNSVNTAKGNKVTTIVGKQGINVGKSSACWVWRPNIRVQDHVSKNSGSYICKRFDYVDPDGRLKSVMA